VRAGDAVLVSGAVGDHGTAVLLAREGLDPTGVVRSDSAPIAAPCLALVGSGVDVRCLRDVTRGGLATVLNEIAASAGVGVRVRGAAVPVRAEVSDACELLGLDPLYVACEGRFVAFVPEADAERALAILREHPVCRDAARIGVVTEEPSGLVTLQSELGSERILDWLSGEQLPRIC
jgi:hydrogenase expression/formation protein HypE